MFTKFSKLSLLALAAACLIAVSAQASSQTAQKAPGDLKARVMKLAAACRPLQVSLGMTDGCGGSPAAMKLFYKVLRGAPAMLRRVKALNQSGMSLCSQLKTGNRDGAPVQFLILFSQQFSKLDCFWGRTGSDHVVLTIKVPGAGKTLPRGTCETLPTVYGAVNCSPVGGGVSAKIAYTTPHRVGWRIVRTTAGCVEQQRWASTQTAFNSRQAGDAKWFNDVTAVLGLPQMSS